MSDEVLIGRKQIIAEVGRSWNTVNKWIKTRGFPAVYIDSRWESDTALIRQWRRAQITKNEISNNK